MSLANECELIIYKSIELEGEDKKNMQIYNKISLIVEERFINKK